MEMEVLPIQLIQLTSSATWIDGVSNAAVNCNGSGGYVAWINGPTKGGRASIST
jgi:hypothetical protein